MGRWYKGLADKIGIVGDVIVLSFEYVRVRREINRQVKTELREVRETWPSSTYERVLNQEVQRRLDIVFSSDI
jgi:hypothetical protein